MRYRVCYRFERLRRARAGLRDAGRRDVVCAGAVPGRRGVRLGDPRLIGWVTGCGLSLVAAGPLWWVALTQTGWLALWASLGAIVASLVPAAAVAGLVSGLRD